ncbi:MAG: hypothetical protein QW065_05300 [Acidilobaceae archaeon]
MIKKRASRAISKNVRKRVHDEEEELLELLIELLEKKREEMMKKSPDAFLF